VSEANNLVCAHVAADHAFGQPRLEWLIHDTAAGDEVRLAARHEILECQPFGQAPTAGMQHLDKSLLAVRPENELDLPDPPGRRCPGFASGHADRTIAAARERHPGKNRL
jgi:hypothetical protein